MGGFFIFYFGALSCVANSIKLYSKRLTNGTIIKKCEK